VSHSESCESKTTDFYASASESFVVARKSSKSDRDIQTTMGGGLSKKKFSKEEKMLKMVSCPNV
jgi:hypothetical protein